jgi:hypothetical protein
MHRWLPTLLLMIFFRVHAESCPRLEGTFHCRSTPAFDISVQNGYKNELPTYTFTDPTGIRDIVADGAFHELKKTERDITRLAVRIGGCWWRPMHRTAKSIMNVITSSERHSCVYD